MIRLRLVDSNRWRVDEVKLDHNHSFDPERAQNSKSHKRMDSRAKRKVEPTLDVEVRTIKLYRMPVVDASGYGSSNSTEGGTSNISCSRRLKLKFSGKDKLTPIAIDSKLNTTNLIIFYKFLEHFLLP